MTNTQAFAKRELEILVKSAQPDNRPIIEPFIPEILALCEKFGLSGQSGGSAPYTATALADAIKHLCLQEPICPITGIDEEWTEVANDGDAPMFQNKRCSALFKIGRNGRAYYLNAIVWKDEKALGWSGSAKKKDQSTVHSRQYVKFPFTPKTFYVDVISAEVQKDDWEFTVKDEKQLQKVFKYYDEYSK